MNKLTNYGYFDDAMKNALKNFWGEEFPVFNNKMDDIFDDKSWIVKKDHYELKYDNIPNNLDTLNVSVEDNSIKIEYSYKDDNSSQSFSAYRSLPKDCDFAKISANVEDNVLSINIPRI